MGCVRAEKAIDTIVVRGISRAAQITMDTGVKRSLDDYLKLAGYANSSTVGAIGLMVYRADTYGLQNAFTMPAIGKDTLKTIYEFTCAEYETRIKPLVYTTRQVQKTYQGVMTGTTGALFDIFRRAGEDNLDMFVEQLLNRKAPC